MAFVLSCPRCLQSRTVSACNPEQNQFCPFCRLEFEPRLLPAKEQVRSSTVRKRRARRWPLLMLTMAVLLLPAGIVGTLLATGQRVFQSEQLNRQDKADRGKVYLSPNEPSKPTLVVSTMTESSDVVVNRRLSPLPAVLAPPPPPPPVSTEVVAMPQESPKEPRPVVSRASKSSRKTPTPWPVRVDQLDMEIRNAELQQELKEALGSEILRTPSCARRNDTEIELRQALAKTPEIDLDSKDPADRNNARAVRQAAQQADATSQHPLLRLARSRADLKGLPFRKESDCQLSPKEAELLSKESLEVRTIVAISVDKKDKANAIGVLDQLPPATLNQIVMAAEPEVRLRAIWALTRSNRSSTTSALANRAVFDLDEGNRLTAVQALRQRQSADYLPVLMEAFRYPWPTAAQNAALALSELNTKGIAPLLVNLLDKPDPKAPFAAKKDEWPMVRELVRVNHLRNCLLCHAPQTATSGKEFRDEVPGLIPPVNEPVNPFSVAYYDGDGKGSFIRADVTYLKQDFSAALSVENPGIWPKEQRYDFFVRVRPATLWERAVPPSNKYPQRDAVLTALRNLTQMDCGEDAAAWRKALKLQQP
jgi:hypothetical protein